MENNIDIRIEKNECVADIEMVLAFNGRIKKGDLMVKYKCYHNDQLLNEYIAEKKLLDTYELDYISHLKKECIKYVTMKS